MLSARSSPWSVCLQCPTPQAVKDAVILAARTASRKVRSTSHRRMRRRPGRRRGWRSRIAPRPAPTRHAWAVWLVAAALGAGFVGLVVERREVVAWLHPGPEPMFRSFRSAFMLAFAVRRRWVGAIGLAAAAAAAASVFACQQIAGIPNDPPVPTAVNACGLPYGTNACAACAATSCCTESSACAADPVCSAYEACLGKANGDWQLRSQCGLDDPVGGSTTVSPLSACLATHCTSECGLTCGGLGATITEPDKAAECQQCQADNACVSEQACASSEVCDAFIRCRFACETTGCLEGCLSAHDASAPAFSSFLGSSHGSCSAPCAYGQDWTCVGKVSWPSSKSDTTTLTVDVQDYETLQFLPGVDVSVCNGSDVNCNPPGLAKGTTNDAGRVVIPVPLPGVGSGVQRLPVTHIPDDQALSLLLGLSTGQCARADPKRTLCFPVGGSNHPRRSASAGVGLWHCA